MLPQSTENKKCAFRARCKYQGRTRASTGLPTCQQAGSQHCSSTAPGLTPGLHCNPEASSADAVRHHTEKMLHTPDLLSNSAPAPPSVCSEYGWSSWANPLKSKPLLVCTASVPSLSIRPTVPRYGQAHFHTTAKPDYPSQPHLMDGTVLSSTHAARLQGPRSK